VTRDQPLGLPLPACFLMGSMARAFPLSQFASRLPTVLSSRFESIFSKVWW
jgi:hypothetical protein